MARRHGGTSLMHRQYTFAKEEVGVNGAGCRGSRPASHKLLSRELREPQKLRSMKLGSDKKMNKSFCGSTNFS